MSSGQVQKLYRGGDTERGVYACIACHGPHGALIGTAYRLSRYQWPNASYLKTQLEFVFVRVSEKKKKKKK